jgi:23S rRNA (uracil1939-C5)-methyltransferase
MQEIPEISSGTVSGLAFGGSGIVRQDGFVIFIPFTAPGDEITFRITEKRKKYAFGELIKVNEPGEERVTSRCPYFGKCGGCQLQHLSYNAQLIHKKEVVQDSLERIGRVEIEDMSPVRPSSEQWAYRRHVTLTLRPKGEGFEAGYIGIDDHLLVPVKVCPIFIEEEDLLLEQVQELVSKLQSTPDNTGKVTILKQESGAPILAFRFENLPGKSAPLFEQAMKDYQWGGVHVTGGKEVLSWGTLTTQWHFEGMAFSLSPQAFSQANPYQTDYLYRKTCEIAAQAKGRRILDLYSGVGITSILLAKQGAKVLGIESNPVAVQLAQSNAKDNGVANVNFQQEDARTAIYGALKQFLPDLIIVNPTRNGLDLIVAHALITELPRQIIYISCMPPTLARDLRLLRAREYTIKSCETLDMFPQTAHVETIVHLSRF